MNKRIFFLLLFLSIIVYTSFICFDSSQIEKSKEQVSNDYKENYLGSEIKELGWNGNTLLCMKGEINSEAYKKVMQRINYFRRMAGVPDVIELNDSLNEVAQAAALIMYANNYLTHEPTKNLKCYSDIGYDGASTSNLSSLIKGEYSQIIADEMEDGGANNKDCGHRAWILKASTKMMGFGATIGSYALCVINRTTNHKPIPDFYSWPPNGYVPYQVVYNKWSFYIPEGEIDFSKTKIEMTVDGKPIRCSILSRNGNFGDPSITWNVSRLKEEFNYMFLSKKENKFIAYSMDEKKKYFIKQQLLDKKISVKITDVKINNELKNFEYDVDIFDPM